MILIQSQFASASAALAFQNNTPSEVILDNLGARNNDTAPQTFSVWVVPSGGTVDPSNLRFTTTISPGMTEPCMQILGDVLGPSDAIYIQAGLASAISIRASGRLRT